ncbi:MAG: DHHA1 domain-containing protein [Thermofilaceae archaeon]|nr:DHHA1 domain-containing protein [Thermofilaceae archaeon]MCX8180825.1 DHHA1 domain-containing protein [Thermofilaceae archaeon]MDW8004611.1 DHHA1 domain-containing protein [Thermofilaceae archaeon]
MNTSLFRFFSIVYALITKRPLALCDIGDLDGITCAALFKTKFPKGVVVLAAPSDIKNSRLIRHTTWTFVGDLPCPGKVLIRADHHATNSPCAVHEFYDPSAGAAALLAQRALGLEGDERATRLVKLAVETDTAKIESDEALSLDAAVKGLGYRGKLHLIDLLSVRPLEEVLEDPRVLKGIKSHEMVRRSTEDLASRLPVNETFVAIFKRRMRVSYRYLCILMERKGAKVTAIVVPRGIWVVRLYLGSSTPSYDVSKIAEKLGGGGHAYAAGATVRALHRRKAFKRILEVIAAHLNKDSLDILVVENMNSIKQFTWPRDL